VKNTNLLEEISRHPEKIKELTIPELERLCAEIRQRIITAVSRTGGHLSSNLGVVELTVALHRIFSLPPDVLIWDVGHQCYTHKLLTGRNDRFDTIRTPGGLSGFPDPEESPADVFRTGHAGTAVSSAAGLALGRMPGSNDGRIIAVIGDGSLTNGLTFEGLNFLGSARKNVLLILNDNKMSISPTKGALAYYLTRLASSPAMVKPKEEFTEKMRKIPNIGDELVRLAEDVEKKAKSLVMPGIFFEKLGIRYFGPIDGHDLEKLTEILANLRDVKEPVVLHVLTRKGRGYPAAEQNPQDFHGAAPFDEATGRPVHPGKTTPSSTIGRLLEETALTDSRLVVLTAAMEKGLGLQSFAERFPDRFFDVGIAEGHCVVFACGLARAGRRPVVAMYSTFFQRTYDQLMHDICLQHLPVIFLVDRAGLVGDDGPTHHGCFDLSFARSLPGIKVFAPYSLENLKETFLACRNDPAPCVIRYPRSYLPEVLPAAGGPAGKPVVALLGLGSMAEPCIRAQALLEQTGIQVRAVSVCAVKPLDEQTRQALASVHRVVTVEENVLDGGFGSAVLEYAADHNLPVRIHRLGLPDAFIEQGDRKDLLNKYGLSAEKIAESVRKLLA